MYIYKIKIKNKAFMVFIGDNVLLKIIEMKRDYRDIKKMMGVNIESTSMDFLIRYGDFLDKLKSFTKLLLSCSGFKSSDVLLILPGSKDKLELKLFTGDDFLGYRFVNYIPLKVLNLGFIQIPEKLSKYPNLLAMCEVVEDLELSNTVDVLSILYQGESLSGLAEKIVFRSVIDDESTKLLQDARLFRLKSPEDGFTMVASLPARENVTLDMCGVLKAI